MRWLALLSLFAAQTALADTLAGTVVKVIDGDTLVIADAAKKRHVVRLAEIDAPERNQRYWVEASRSLAELCYRKGATVDWTERDRRRRYIGYVTCEGKDANAEQLKRGMAWASPRATKPTSPLYELETYARLRRIGLWADDNAVPPWEFTAKKQ
ncbi:MAG TPA: thermonuclease family protein [Burkholderiales bacterium]|nr:thermonuclease family protein [Burkholderiales bacterium]